MTLEFDLPARWRSLLTEQFSDEIHDLQVTWPDNQGLLVDYRVIEAFNPEFASSIIDKPDGHLSAANRVLRDLLIEEMTSVGELDVPLKVDLEIGENWANCQPFE